MSTNTDIVIARCLDAIGLDSLEEWFEMGASYGGPLDSVIVGGCVTEGCEGICESCEPDMRDGFCEDCGNSTVHSLADLVGII